jgi:hypothetical protein
LAVALLVEIGFFWEIYDFDEASTDDFACSSGGEIVRVGGNPEGIQVVSFCEG